MIKLAKLIQDCGILGQDLQALDILQSGIQDSQENKLAVKTFALALARKCTSITKELERQAGTLA